MGIGTLGLFDYWTSGSLTFRLLDFCGTFRLWDFWTVGPWDFWTLDFGTGGLWDFWTLVFFDNSESQRQFFDK